jgi:hypothetical protein
MTNARNGLDAMGNRDDVRQLGSLPNLIRRPYNVYEIVSEYTLCAPISSSMRS